MEHLIEAMKRQSQLCIRKVVHTFRFSACCSNQKLKPEAARIQAIVRGVLVLLQHMKGKTFYVKKLCNILEYENVYIVVFCNFFSNM
jgi:hypothetical protein